MGNPGCLSIFGHDPREHQALVEHFTSEYPIKTMAKDRTVDEWKLKLGRPNHWWDNIVSAAVAASKEGVALPTFEQATVEPYTKIRLSDIQRAKRGY